MRSSDRNNTMVTTLLKKENLFWWRHLDINSDPLLRSVVLFAKSIVSFSVRHRLHRLDRLEYPEALLNIRQLIRRAFPSCLSFQTRFDHSVLFSISLMSEARLMVRESLRKDIVHIRDSQAVFVPADKTRNLYRMGKAQYEKLLRENITRHWRRLIMMRSMQRHRLSPANLALPTQWMWWPRERHS